MPATDNTPALTLPVELNVVAEITFAPTILPPEPLVLILPNVPLPEALNVPATLAPVPVTTTMFALPPTLVVTLPPLVAIFYITCAVTDITTTTATRNSSPT